MELLFQSRFVLDGLRSLHDERYGRRKNHEHKHYADRPGKWAAVWLVQQNEQAAARTRAWAVGLVLAVVQNQLVFERVLHHVDCGDTSTVLLSFERLQKEVYESIQQEEDNDI